MENQGGSPIPGVPLGVEGEKLAWLSAREPREPEKAPRGVELPAPLLVRTRGRGVCKGASDFLHHSPVPEPLSFLFSKPHCSLLPSKSPKTLGAPVPTFRPARHPLPSSRDLTFTWAGRSLAWRMPVGSSPAAEPLSAPSPLAMTRGPRRLGPGRRDAPVFCRPALARGSRPGRSRSHYYVSRHLANQERRRRKLPCTPPPRLLKVRSCASSQSLHAPAQLAWWSLAAQPRSPSRHPSTRAPNP